MKKTLVILSLFIVFEVNALEIGGFGFKARENINILKSINNKYKTFPGYLFEYQKGVFYSLSKTGRAVGVYDLNDPNHKLEGWGIERWSLLKAPPEINFAPGMMKNENISFNPRNASAGCLTKTPLRYGDVEDDGTKEIILVLDDELIIFSPEYERTVFSTFIDVSDWWPYGEKFLLATYLKDNDEKMPDETKLYHGYSHSWADRADRGQFEPGVRAYSKIFVGDFDDDGNPDIIKWEKVYRSNQKTASIAWNKVRSNLTHYERDLDVQKVTGAGVTGEYLPQITMDVIIEGWMRDRELTWQKGYPSKSECAGQEGLLIPEMHDPLLNDPDVLK